MSPPTRRGAAVPRRPSRSRSTSSPTPLQAERGGGRAARCASCAAALDGRGVVLREVAGGWTLASHPDAEEAARRLLARPRTPGAHARPGRDAGDRRLPAAGVAPGGRPHPRRRLGVGDRRAGRARADRGGRPLAVRRRALPHHAAVPEAVRAAARSTSCPSVAQWDPSPEDEAALRDRLLRRRRRRAADASRLTRRSWPQAASMSRPRVRRTVARRPCSSSAALNASIAPRRGALVDGVRSGCTGSG